MTFRKRLVEGPLTRLGIASGHRALLALGATWRVRHADRRHVDDARLGIGPVLYVFSHGLLLPLAWTHRDRDARLLISRSRDGEIITRVTSKLGFHAVRGSSSRGGRDAIEGLCAALQAGHDVAITPDGPRGPRGSAGPGAAVVAHRSGVAIVPVGVAADRAWRMRSWDRFLVPKPGARIRVAYGAALWPGRDGETLDVEAVSRAVENAMAAVEARAQELLAARPDALPADAAPARVPA